MAPFADTNLASLSRVETRKMDVLDWITVIVALVGGTLATLPRQRARSKTMCPFGRYARMARYINGIACFARERRQSYAFTS